MKVDKKLIGLVFIVIAAGVGYMGYNESQGAVSQISSALNGNPTDDVMIKYISAAVLGVAGLYFLLRK
jgi:hypothetical protein